MTVYPASVLRTVALTAQGLQRAGNAPADAAALLAAIRQTGCLQIDTLQMVARSQYLALWSRLGAYDPGLLDELTFGPERQLFEGWQHAACIIPLEEYRYQLPHQRNLRDHPTSWYNRWLNETVQKDFVPSVLERIRREGGLKVSDFERGSHTGGTWWNWRPAKVALEYLYAMGHLMVAKRVKFQRVYDLTERVLPAWVDRSEPGLEERDRFWVERGARALGVCAPRHAGDYTWMKVGKSRPVTAALLRDGVLVPVQGRLEDGTQAELIVHRDNLPLLEQAADGALTAERTTFLSPFDSLWWAARRDLQLWNFHQTLEAYLPASKRIHGYFCLPILHRDRLVGRFDPKLERRAGLLRLKSLTLEPGIKPSHELVAAVAAALRDFMNFHQAGELVIEASQPAVFGKKLLAAL